ncbi:glycosyltransferase [Flavobacterium sp.]|uniref:glycosyltransferase n=1 Tax=Flavobacterium sp. TaxID=239 RepID=UPI002604C93D|nr:glycosyltransferase [Flavobacterium sp.]
MQKNISVIVVVNNNSELLKKAIWSYNTQAFRNFEMIIVNQNYDETISKSITSIAKEVFFPIIYLDSNSENAKEDFLKNAVEKSTTNYILFTTSDCIARPDFVEEHIKNRVEGCYLNGSFISIDKSTETAITKEILYASDCFNFKWLQSNGLTFVKSFKASYSGLWNTFFDMMFSKNDISLENLSGWKSDFMKIKNFSNFKNSDFNAIELKSKSIRCKSVLLKPKQ